MKKNIFLILILILVLVLILICQRIFSPNSIDIHAIYNSIQLDDDRQKIRKKIDLEYISRGKEQKNDWYQYDDEFLLFCYEGNKLIMKVIINNKYGVVDGTLQSKRYYSEKLSPDCINELDYEMDLTDIWELFGFNFSVAGDFKTIMLCYPLENGEFASLHFRDTSSNLDKITILNSDEVLKYMQSGHL